MGEADGDESAPTKGQSDAAPAATTSSSSSMSDVPAKKLARQLDFTGFGGAQASVAVPELPKPQLATVSVQQSQPKPPVVAVPVPVPPQPPISSVRPV